MLAFEQELIEMIYFSYGALIWKPPECYQLAGDSANFSAKQSPEIAHHTRSLTMMLPRPPHVSIPIKRPLWPLATMPIEKEFTPVKPEGSTWTFNWPSARAARCVHLISPAHCWYYTQTPSRCMACSSSQHPSMHSENSPDRCYLFSFPHSFLISSS